MENRGERPLSLSAISGAALEAQGEILYREQHVLVAPSIHKVEKVDPAVVTQALNEAFPGTIEPQGSPFLDTQEASRVNATDSHPSSYQAALAKKPLYF